MIFVGSMFLKDPESRYSPVEGEALAVVFALRQATMFVLGFPKLIVATDHKLLVPILNGRRLDKSALVEIKREDTFLSL